MNGSDDPPITGEPLPPLMTPARAEHVEALELALHRLVRRVGEIEAWHPGSLANVRRRLHELEDPDARAERAPFCDLADCGNDADWINVETGQAFCERHTFETLADDGGGSDPDPAQREAALLHPRGPTLQGRNARPPRGQDASPMTTDAIAAAAAGASRAAGATAEEVQSAINRPHDDDDP